jgi:anti-sigma factor RsiW
MTCAEALDLIEAVAAGDTPRGNELEAHLAGCPGCAAALDAALRIERALVALPAVPAPARFAQDVMAAVRRDRWRSEERIDRLFNVMITSAVLIVVVSLVSLFNVGSLAQMLMTAIDTVSAISRRPAALDTSRALSAVGLTALLLTGALGLWWWAERRSGYEME